MIRPEDASYKLQHDQAPSPDQFRTIIDHVDSLLQRGDSSQIDLVVNPESPVIRRRFTVPDGGGGISHYVSLRDFRTFPDFGEPDEILRISHETSLTSHSVVTHYRIKETQEEGVFLTREVLDEVTIRGGFANLLYQDKSHLERVLGMSRLAIEHINAEEADYQAGLDIASYNDAQELIGLLAMTQILGGNPEHYRG